MNKVINGHMYNTETAKLLGTNESNCGMNDFRWFEEELYRTKAGYFFLHGEGGPLTRYAEPAYGGGWTSGERIIPMSEAEARKWAEDVFDGEEYEKVFGEVDEETALLTIRAPQTVIDAFNAKKAESGKTSGELLKSLLET